MVETIFFIHFSVYRSFYYHCLVTFTHLVFSITISFKQTINYYFSFCPEIILMHFLFCIIISVFYFPSRYLFFVCFWKSLDVFLVLFTVLLSVDLSSIAFNVYSQNVEVTDSWNVTGTRKNREKIYLEIVSITPTLIETNMVESYLIGKR